MEPCSQLGRHNQQSDVHKLEAKHEQLAIVVVGAACDARGRVLGTQRGKNHAQTSEEANQSRCRQQPKHEDKAVEASPMTTLLPKGEKWDDARPCQEVGISGILSHPSELEMYAHGNEGKLRPTQRREHVWSALQGRLR